MEDYTVEPQIVIADCLTALREMPDASVDAVVTDPPYGLADHKPDAVTATLVAWSSGDRERVPSGRGGFMGRAWDSFVPPPAVWDECLRVLKPGGHLLVFAGSRTVDLMGLSVRLAGFEIRDSITWLYGCHDDQTEVLTARGWVNGLDLDDDDQVAQWATDGTISLIQPTARQRYPFDGRLVRFRNADVDQLVTPNHRVYLQSSERTQVDGVRTSTWSDWRVEQAADVNRWQRMRLPAAGVHNGPGIGGADYAALLGWVWAEGGFDLTGTGVRVYQSSVNAPFVTEIADLLDRLGPHKRYDYQRAWRGREYTSTTWFISGDLARRVRADLPGKTPSWDLLWRMTAAEKRALWDAAMKGDGSKARRTFWQKDRAALEWVQALLASIDCRGKIATDPRGALHWTDRPTVELQARHLADDGKDYTGEVWCVTVPSGAFVVRRNGRVSVSGNSGFPKSLDVSKAIDQRSSNERERRDIPATDAARQWQGWGTALKPASEPIIVARKPLSGTVAANVMAHGTGALNIDACRVGTDEKLGRFNNAKPAEHNVADSHPAARNLGRMQQTAMLVDNSGGKGRWPANVVLDEDAAAELDAQTGTLQTSKPGTVRRKTDHCTDAMSGTLGTLDRAEVAYGDSGGASRFFYCAKAPTSERPKVDGQGHPTVKPLTLMRWLVRLVTPPGGTVLDPFAGTGTTGEAARMEGFGSILIDNDPVNRALMIRRLGGEP